MKKHFYILHFLLFVATFSFAQKQITNFDNRVNKQAINPVHQSQIGDKIIYSAFSPASGNELWVSDGTKANTKLLKDIVPGYQSSYPSDITRNGGLLYFVINGYEVWKTDGSTAGTEKLLHSDSTLNLNIVSGKLLVTFRNTATQRFAFAWLGENGETDFLNEDATTFRYSNGNLYYGLHDSTSNKWTLRAYDTEARTLASHAGPPLNDIVVERQNGYDYIAVDAGYAEKKLVVSPANRAENPKTYDWNRGPAPLMLRDKAGALFLINDGGFFNNNVTLKIYKVVEGHNWETVADIVTSMLYANTPTGSNEGPFHTNFVIEGDQLAFTSLFGYEGIYSAYLGVFDFKKNTKRISPNLPREVMSREVKIVPQSRDVFEMRTNFTKCTYNIAENKPVSIEQVPRQVRKVKVGDTEFELSDNVYASGTTIRLPLMNNRPVYTEKFLTYRTVLHNKLLFWTNNEEQGSGKLWVSDGKTTSELLSYNGVVSSWRIYTDSMRVGNQLVFSTTGPQGIRIFKTDGTRAGTREIYFYQSNESPSIDKVITNDRMAVVEVRFRDKLVVLVTDLEKTWVIDDPRFLYREFRATSNDIFLVHSSTRNGMAYDMVYRFDNGDLKPIELNKGGADAMGHVFFDNRIFYMLRNSSGQLSDVCYTDAGSDKVNRLFSGPMTSLYRKNDFLIAGTMSGTDVKIYKASTAQLLGEFSGVNIIDMLTNPAAGLRGNREIVVLHNDRMISQKFTEDIESALTVPQGILIKLKGNAGGSWHIYDMKRGKITALFKDQSVEFATISSNDHLLFADGNDRHNILWDLAKERRVDFPAGLWVHKSLNGDLVVATDLDHTMPMTVYSVEGNAPVKKYELGLWNEFMNVNDANYIPANTVAAGFELTRIDRDSLYRFPEIIRGPEGISLQEAFQFRGSVYAAAFTFSKGFQVWKMDEMNLTPDDDNELVVSRPEMPGRGPYLPDDIQLNAYPNPMMNELNIDLREGGLIRIIDPKGFEHLKTVVGKSKTLDVKGLPAGEYIIIYSGANGHITKKIVKL